MSRETFLEAVFLWITPLAFALSIALMVLFKAVFALSIFLFATSNSTFFERVFTVFLTAWFLSVIFLVCLTLFLTDLLFFGTAFAGKRLFPFQFTRLERKPHPGVMVCNLQFALNNKIK